MRIHPQIKTYIKFFFILFFSTSFFSQVTFSAKDSNFTNIFFDEVDSSLYFISENSSVKYSLKNWQRKTKLIHGDPFRKKPLFPVSVEGENYFLDKLGGIVYKLKRDSLHRIDKSFTHKMQIDCAVFTYKNNIYKFGGYGFWSNRNFITKFNFETKQWDLVSHKNTKELPEGTHQSYAKVIGDYLYVFGGVKNNKYNPLKKEINKELWRFDLKMGIWKNLGELNIPLKYIDLDRMFDFNNSIVLFHQDEIYTINLKENKLIKYQKNGVSLLLSFTIKPFILNNQIVAIFDDGQEKEKQTLKKLDFTTILGPKLEVKTFVKNRILKLQIIILIAILVTIYGLFSALKRSRKNKNKIIVTKKGAFFFKKKRMHLGDLEHKIISLLLQSEKVIYTSDLLNIMDAPQFNYSHQTRILNDVLQKINDLYKTLSQQESNLIVTRKSSLDKRLKEYVIDKNIFVVK